MLFCVVGTSSSFAYWAFDLASCVMKLAFDDFHRIHCTGAAEMLVQWENRKDKPVLFTTDFLEDGLSEILLSSGARIVAVLDSVETAITTAAVLRKMSFVDCVRHTSLYLASLDHLLSQDNTLIFGPEYLDASFDEFINLFLLSINIKCDADQIFQAMRGKNLDWLSSKDVTVREMVELTRQTIPVQDVISNWSATEMSSFEVMSNNFHNILGGNLDNPFVCPLELFHCTSRDFKLSGPIDLMGPARLLIWGPYLYLPKSNWTVTMEFEVTESLSWNSVTADILLGGIIASIGEFDLPVRGIFSWQMNFQVVDISKSIEVRLLLSRSAIEGRLALRKVEFSLQSARS